MMKNMDYGINELRSDMLMLAETKKFNIRLTSKYDYEIMIIAVRSTVRDTVRYQDPSTHRGCVQSLNSIHLQVSGSPREHMFVLLLPSSILRSTYVMFRGGGVPAPVVAWSLKSA